MLRPNITQTLRAVRPCCTRPLATATVTAPKPLKKEGDISDSFASLSGGAPPLPDRFRQLKCDLIRGKEQKIADSWVRLLRELREENAVVAKKGSAVIPQVEYKDLEKGIKELKGEIKKRGVVVVKGVVPEEEARAYKDEIQEYVRKNPHTRGENNMTLLCT